MRRRSFFRRFLRWLFYKPNQSFAVIGLVAVALVMSYRWFDREFPGVFVFGSDVNNFVPAVAASNWIAGKPSVIDGDTIEIHGQRIRLYGIDAPESDQQCQYLNGKDWPCGRRAAEELQKFIGQNVVTCTERDRDRYKRIVAVCRLGTKGSDLSGYMVTAGYALAYRRYSMDYVGGEDFARQKGIGMWMGTFQPPWEFRAAKRNGSVTE